MKAKPIRVYLDSNVLIAYVANEEGRAGLVQSMLDDAQDEKIELLTSVLSITEVAYVATDQNETYRIDSVESIDEFWTPSSPIDVIDISIKVAREARAIIRQSKIRGMKVVKPADAIHLASASIHNCDRLFTYESEPSRRQWAKLIQLTVAEPFLDEPRLDIGT